MTRTLTLTDLDDTSAGQEGDKDKGAADANGADEANGQGDEKGEAEGKKVSTEQLEAERKRQKEVYVR